MKKVIIIAVSILMVVSGIAVAALYYVGDKMVNTVIDSEIDDVLAEQPSTANSASRSGDEVKVNANRDELTQDKSADTADGVNKGNDSDNGISKTTGKKANANSNEGTSEGNNKGKDLKTEEKKVQYTVEKMKEVKDKVSAADKISSAALLVKRLNADDINELKSMLPGGVDAAEKKRAEEIMYKRFTPEEIKTIKDLYKKYMNQ